MCASSNRKATTAMRRVDKFTAYKVIQNDGRSEWDYYRYSPGVHEVPGLKAYRYSADRPRGFHVYTSRQAAQNDAWRGFSVVSIRCRGKDVIAAEAADADDRQVVLRRIEITNRAWRAFQKKVEAAK